MITYDQSVLLVILIAVAVIIGIGAIAITALRRADKALGMDVNNDFDSQLWRSLLLDELIKIMRIRFAKQMQKGDLTLLKTWRFKCPKCDWKGASEQLVVDHDAGGSNHMCPKCGADISLSDHIKKNDE